MKFLKHLAMKLGAMRKAGKVVFSESPPAPGTADLVADGFEPTDADQPTREELVDLGLVEEATTSDRSDVKDLPLEGSLADRRRLRAL